MELVFTLCKKTQIRTASKRHWSSVVTQVTDVATDNMRCSHVQHHIHLRRLRASHFLRVTDCARVFLNNNNHQHLTYYHTVAFFLHFLPRDTTNKVSLLHFSSLYVLYPPTHSTFRRHRTEKKKGWEDLLHRFPHRPEVSTCPPANWRKPGKEPHVFILYCVMYSK